MEHLEGFTQCTSVRRIPRLRVFNDRYPVCAFDIYSRKIAWILAIEHLGIFVFRVQSNWRVYYKN